MLLLSAAKLFLDSDMQFLRQPEPLPLFIYFFFYFTLIGRQGIPVAEACSSRYLLMLYYSIVDVSVGQHVADIEVYLWDGVLSCDCQIPTYTNRCRLPAFFCISLDCLRSCWTIQCYVELTFKSQDVTQNTISSLSYMFIVHAIFSCLM